MVSESNRWRRQYLLHSLCIKFWSTRSRLFAKMVVRGLMHHRWLFFVITATITQVVAKIAGMYPPQRINSIWRPSVDRNRELRCTKRIAKSIYAARNWNWLLQHFLPSKTGKRTLQERDWKRKVAVFVNSLEKDEQEEFGKNVCDKVVTGLYSVSGCRLMKMFCERYCMG